MLLGIIGAVILYLYVMEVVYSIDDYQRSVDAMLRSCIEDYQTSYLTREG
jgi:hypothetical protein